MLRKRRPACRRGRGRLRRVLCCADHRAHARVAAAARHGRHGARPVHLHAGGSAGVGPGGELQAAGAVRLRPLCGTEPEHADAAGHRHRARRTGLRRRGRAGIAAMAAAGSRRPARASMPAGSMASMWAASWTSCPTRWRRRAPAWAACAWSPPRRRRRCSRRQSRQAHRPSSSRVCRRRPWPDRPGRRASRCSCAWPGTHCRRQRRERRAAGHRCARQPPRGHRHRLGRTGRSRTTCACRSRRAASGCCRLQGSGAPKAQASRRRLPSTGRRCQNGCRHSCSAWAAA